MMVKKIETITDRDLFPDILNKFFLKRTAFIPSGKGNIEVKFINSPGSFDAVCAPLVKIFIPVVLEEPKNCMAFTRHGANLIVVFLKLVQKISKNIFLFNPVKFQIVAAERRDERKSLLSSRDSNEKAPVYITNFISDKVIRRLLSGQESKLNRIKEIIEYGTYNEYDHFKIFFNSENANDLRMRFFYKNRDPIHIPDVNSRDESDGNQKYYRSNICNNDVYLKLHKELISEISAPVLFDSKIPYGYIQVNNKTGFSNSTVAIIRRLASLADELNRKNKLFSVSAERLLVSDVSQKGIGIVFRDQKYIPYCKKDSFVSLDMLLPMAKKASMLADVRHLEMTENRIIKAGFQIKDMDNASKDNYERFLGSISA